MIRSLASLLTTVAVSTFAFAQTPSAAVTGFDAADGTAELRWERQFQQYPNAQSLRESLRTLTAQPHMAGTPADRATAEYVDSVFRSAGLKSVIVPYSARLPYPVEVRVELVRPNPQTLPDYESPIPGDPFSEMKDGAPGFNAYSPSGDVTAPVVYANYGLENDYAELARQNVSVKGKIVLVRYGKSYRGIKSLLAQRADAVGVLIYSDPNDDGYHAGDTYPHGAYRPPSGIQRGSILNNNYPGMPLQPGQTPGPSEQAAWNALLPKLPTAPISYEAARPILVALQGAAAPSEWQGGLAFTYHLGGTDAVAVHMRLRMDDRYRTIWNVIGTLPGSSPGEVVLGNHRDAWVFGAVDPNSGTMALLETARALGRLHQAGWTPRRSIVLCSWDAEEFDLIGSTDFALQHLDQLRRDGVAYINTDSGDFGPDFGAGAVPSMYNLIEDVTRQVTDIDKHKSVYDLWTARVNEGRHTDSHRTSATSFFEDLGGGSDFEPFLGHVGLASADIGFSGSYGVYHALYDDFHYFSTESDPDFTHAVELTQILGLLAMRLSDAQLLPLQLVPYAHAISTYLNEARTGATEIPARQLHWDAALNAAMRLERSAAEFGARAASALSSGNSARLSAFNTALAGFEQTLLHEQGLPDRAFFRHLIFAPEITRGYSAARLPGLTERLRAKDWANAQIQLDYLVEALNTAANRLDAVR